MTWTRGASRLALVAAVWLAASRCEAACTVSTTGVSFGSYNVYSASDLDSTGTVTYSCGIGTLSISIDLSRGSSSGFNPRTMNNGSNTLNYNLYMDAARSSIWGNGTAGTSHYTTSATALLLGGGATLTVYGRVPALQDAAAGAHSDTIVVTINF